MFTLKGQVLGIDFLIIGIMYIICGCLAAISEVSIKIFRKYMKSNLKFNFSHKNLQNLPHGSDIFLVNVQTKGPNHKEDSANFYGFLRKAELY